MNMGKRLTKLMKDKDLSQAEVARGIGTSRQRVFQLMTDKEWNARNIQRLSTFLNVPVFKWFQR